MIRRAMNMANNGYTAPEVGPSCWNGVQIQEAPTIPVIYGSPAPQKIFVGQTAHFTSRIAGLPPITDTWTLDGNTINNGGKITGATSPVLTYGNVSSGGTVTLVAGNVNGSATNSAPSAACVPDAFQLERTGLCQSRRSPHSCGFPFHKILHLQNPTLAAGAIFSILTR